MESPFEGIEFPDTPVHRPHRPGDVYEVLSEQDLEDILKIPPHQRTYDPYRCMFNLDGGRQLTTRVNQCATRIADPLRSRYCLDHATELGVVFYAPEEHVEIIRAEAQSNLLRLVPKSIATLADVLDDPTAPAGVRSKAAEGVLNRTGYPANVSVDLKAEVTVTDATQLISDRLDALAEVIELRPRVEVEEIVEAELEVEEAEEH